MKTLVLKSVSSLVKIVSISYDLVMDSVFALMEVVDIPNHNSDSCNF